MGVQSWSHVNWTWEQCPVSNQMISLGNLGTGNTKLLARYDDGKIYGVQGAVIFHSGSCEGVKSS